MSNYKFYFLLATSSLMILLFSCKRKNSINEETKKPGIITSNSYSLQDFVIQDAADARVLDFMDVHRIVQEADTIKVRQGAVDTIYFAILESIDVTTLKLKPRFYDAGRVVSVEADTSEVRDFSNNGIEYPTMKIKFNTGLTRTFAIVASKVLPNQDNINLLINQHTYYVNEYKVYNNDNSNIASHTKIKLTNHLPILLQSSIEDTIEFSVVYNDVAGNTINFAPLKYGDANTDTVVATINPTTLTFDKTDVTTLANYKTMSITFANGFIRKYAVKASVIDNNENLNKNAYIIGKYNFQYPENTAITGLAEVKFTQHTPTDRIMQIDTIEVTVPSTFSGSYVHFSVTNYGLDPATYAANDSVKTTVKVTGIAHGGTTALTPATGTGVPANALVVPNTEFGEYVTITYTFSNEFKREYAVKVTKQLVTTVNITNFQVSNDADGHSVEYYRARDSFNITSSGNTLITQHMRDTGRIIIVRPLNWADGRKIKIKLTGVDAAVQGTVSVFNAGENIGSSSGGSASLTDGSFVLDFTNVNSDSLKLTLQNTNPGGEIKNYTIILLSGMIHARYQPANVILAAGASRDNINFPVTYNTTYDKELGIAVDANNVYVLKLDRINPTTPAGTTGPPIFADFRQGATSIIAYDISTGTGNISSAMAVAMPPASDSTRIVSIFSVDNTLYGLALSVLKADSTSTFKYYVYKWSGGSATVPTRIGAKFNGSSTHVFTSVYPVDNGSGNIDLYASPTGGNTNSLGIFKISISPSNVGNATAGTKIAGTGGGNATGATYINTKGISLITTNQPLVYYKGEWNTTVPSTPYPATNNFNRYNTAGIVNGSPLISWIGGDIQTIRDKNYFFVSEAIISGTNNADGQGGAIFDFGINFTKLDALMSNIISGNSPLFSLKVKNYPFFSSAVLPTSYYSPYYNRGGCRTYVLSDGIVRVAYLVNGIGFQVWDLK